MFLEIKQKRMAVAMLDHVHNCDAAMKVSVGYYRNSLNNGDTSGATGHIKRAARLPYRVEARIQAMVAKHGAAYIDAALTRISDLRLADLAAELAPLKVYSDTLKDNFQNQGWTEEQIANDIEANRADVDRDEVVPIPVGYEDDI